MGRSTVDAGVALLSEAAASTPVPSRRTRTDDHQPSSSARMDAEQRTDETGAKCARQKPKTCSSCRLLPVLVVVLLSFAVTNFISPELNMTLVGLSQEFMSCPTHIPLTPI